MAFSPSLYKPSGRLACIQHSLEAAMGLLLHLLSATFMFVIVVRASHDVLEPRAYWRTVLPHTPMPTAIEQLLQPDVNAGKPDTSATVGENGVNVNTDEGTSVNVGEGGVNVNTPKGTSVNVGGVGVNTGNSKPSGTAVGVGEGGVNVNTKGTTVNVGVHVKTGPSDKPGGTTHNVGKGGVAVDVKPKGKPVVVNVGPLNFKYAASDTQSRDNPAVALFFLRRDLRVGKKFTLQLGEGGGGAAFVPRSEAQAVPFSTARLPTILSRYNIPAGSADAAAMQATLRGCETAPAAGEKKRCATSLESMVDFATESLGTREVVAVGTEGGDAAAGERRVYKVGSVRRVASAGGKGVVSCHPESYVHAVFFCHATTASEIYEVEMAVEGGGKAVKAVAVCHTDTARWNPKHLAFRVLQVKPGTVPVCHFLPRNHVVWAVKV